VLQRGAAVHLPDTELSAEGCFLEAVVPLHSGPRVGANPPFARPERFSLVLTRVPARPQAREQGRGQAGLELVAFGFPSGGVARPS
jgi:hypothetical protein